jgi:sugar phosphate isomerase/epimerase
MSWPLAFSTLGCSGLPLPDVVALAQSSGWLGLELRAAEDEPVHVGLSAAERASVRRLLTDGGVVPLAVASYVKVASGSISDADCVADAVRHAELASDLGAPYVRVFPGGESSGPDADQRAARRLSAISESLPDDVTVLLETHDSHPRGVDIARVLEQVPAAGAGRVAAIWDVLHPWRFDEPLAVTADALAPFLMHVQVKDVASAQERTPLPLGDGTVPLSELYGQLRRLGYQGWLSLEWESKWHPDARPLAEALSRRPSVIS